MVTANEAPTTPAAAIEALIEKVRALAAVANRNDLVDRLGETAARLRSPGQQVLVVGDYKQGKSSLVNGLMGADISPVDDDLATAVPCVLNFAERPSSALAVEEDGRQTLRPVRFAVGQKAVVQPCDGVQFVRMSLPRGLLKDGLMVVDTPGTGGLSSPAAALAISAARHSGVVVVVSAATQPLTGSELAFLRQAATHGSRVLLALTKIDLTRHWERVAVLDRAHLIAAGLPDVAIIPTSAALRRTALRRAERGLNARSGYPQLTAALLTSVSGEQLAVNALDELADVLTQLASSTEATSQALRSARAGGRAAELADVKQRADVVRRAGTRWQQALNDGVATLTSDVEFDVRTRLRGVVKEFEEILDSSDPLDTWSDIQQQLGARLAAELADHQDTIEHRATALAGEVGVIFAEYDVTQPVFAELGMRAGAATPLRAAEIELSRSGIGARVLTALRGGTSSIMMFTLLPTVLGLPVFTPLILVAGLGLGAKSLRDESKRQLSARRAAAKTAMRKLVDEVTLAETKQSRDTVRAVHRALRDGFTARTDELTAAVTAAAKAAQATTTLTQHDRDAQLKRVEADLRALSDLRAELDRVRSLTTPTTAGTSR